MLTSNLNAAYHAPKRCDDLSSVLINFGSKEFFCHSADPFASDVNFVICVLTLEELGATGNKARSVA